MPVVQEIMKGGKTIQASKIPDAKENFEDEEAAKLVEKAEKMEAKAKNGHIEEANCMFVEIFEEIKKKRFTERQETLQCTLYSKFVSIHNEKHSYDEAQMFTMKTLDLLSPHTSSTQLQIEVCANSAIAFECTFTAIVILSFALCTDCQH